MQYLWLHAPLYQLYIAIAICGRLTNIIPFSVFNNWQMNPYDRSPAFGKRQTMRVWCNFQSVWCQACFKFTACFSFAFLCFGSTTAIGPDGFCCQSREFKEWHGCRSTKGVTKGLFLKDDVVTFYNLTFLFLMTSWCMPRFVQGSITMRWHVMTRVCAASAGPPVRQPSTWVIVTLLIAH